jgi:hypothetical protein
MMNSVYHIVLRTSALTLALVLLFVSGVISPVTQELSVNTRLYLANTIGMNAAVLPNEYNTLNAQLQTRAQELEQREIAVALKEKKSETFDISTFTLSIILFVMLILLVLNYVLDFLRVQSKRTMTIQNEKMA